jgi:hypothetical protein
MSFNPLDYPMLLADPLHLPNHRAWIGHIPFAFALVQMARPDVLVELGVYQGSSYCAFCQAVAHLQLPTRCFAIDSWRGDAHTGNVEDRTLEELRAHHDPLYGGFSTLLRTEFDTALPQFEDGSIDVLHIDGLHTYDAVKHDFETWLPKLSDTGVVLLHDTTVRKDDFGVWRLWEEVSKRYPSFEFTHSYGLGVLAVGDNAPPGVLQFIKTARERSAHVQRMFSVLADRIYKETFLQRLGTFLDATQGYLDNWRRHIGQHVDDSPIDGQRDPLGAAQRVARDMQSIAAASG